MNKSTPLICAITALAMAACSPANDTAENATENTTDSAAATADASAQGGTTAGGMVSPPQSNEAIDTAATTETDTSTGSNSFTEGQARGHIEKAGYGDITGLTKTPDGLWTAKAMKDGKAVTVSLDFKGAVTAK